MEENRTNEELLSISNLTVEYVTDEETIYALNGVDLMLHKGETLGLVGETGAGKTTIAKSIMRILPDPPAVIREGSISFMGEDLLKVNERRMRKIRGKEIAMIFQDPMTALNPTLTIGHQISEIIRLHEKTSKANAEKKAIDMLETVGIPGSRFSEYPHQFSGGMKQRVVIAMALACEPKLLLSDEATTALDVTIQAQVLDMMMKLKKKLGTAMVMITHDLGIIAETCDTVAVIYAGQIVEYGSVYQIFDHPSHPYTVGLFESLPNFMGNEKRLKPIPGLMADPTVQVAGCRFADRCAYATEECRTGLPAEKVVEPGHTVRCIHSLEGRNAG